MTAAARYGKGAEEAFEQLGALSEVGGHAGVTRFLYRLYQRRPDLLDAYPGIDGDGAWLLVDWAYRFGAAEVPIPTELLPTAWLREPADPDEAPDLPRYLTLLHARRPDLQERFPDVPGVDTGRFLEWAHTVSPEHDPVMRAVLDRDDPEPPAWRARAAKRRRGGIADGVNVIGLLRGELGLGEAARAVIAGLDAAGVPLLPVARRANESQYGHRFAAAGLEEAAFRTNLVSLNPDQHWTLAGEAGYPAERYAIGYWWWEVADVLPLEWRLGFRLVDEVWTGSEHTAAAIRAVAPVPVMKMPVAVEPRPVAPMSRADLGLPEGYVFLTLFDYNSTVDRKNPRAAIEAFRAAFEPGGGASLVLKSVNGDRHPQRRAELEAAAGGRPDIHFVDRYATAAEKNAMLAACDCYVSLHRAEGFGLPLAEAMFLGRPAIATGYSGNLEFMTADNSFLVDHRMVEVGPGAEPYYPATGHWAEPDVADAARAMRAAFDDPEGARARATRGQAAVRRECSAEAAGRAMAARLEELWSQPAEGGRPDAALAEALAAVERAAAPARSGSGSGSRGGGPRALARTALERALRPYAHHQQRLNRELAAAVARLDVDRAAAERRTLLARAELLATLRERDAELADLAAGRGRRL